MVKAFYPNDQAMLSGYDFVFQLSDICFICWFSKVVSEDAYECIKKHHTRKRRTTKSVTQERQKSCSKSHMKWRPAL